MAHEGEQQKMTGQGVPFQRTRRITGYLVGTLDRWSDAKRAEERDRVKHGLESCESERLGRQLPPEVRG